MKTEGAASPVRLHIVGDSPEFLFQPVKFVEESVVLDLHGSAGNKPRRNELADDDNVLWVEQVSKECQLFFFFFLPVKVFSTVQYASSFQGIIPAQLE